MTRVEDPLAAEQAETHHVAAAPDPVPAPTPAPAPDPTPAPETTPGSRTVREQVVDREVP